MTHASRRMTLALIASLLCLWSIGSGRRRQEGYEEGPARRIPRPGRQGVQSRQADRRVRRHQPGRDSEGARRLTSSARVDDAFPAGQDGIVIGGAKGRDLARPFNLLPPRGYQPPAPHVCRRGPPSRHRQHQPRQRPAQTVPRPRQEGRYRRRLPRRLHHAGLGQQRRAWKKFEAFTKAANFGIGGDQTGHVLWRLTEGKEFDDIKPKAVVLMIGTNNTGGIPPRRSPAASPRSSRPFTRSRRRPRSCCSPFFRATLSPTAHGA